jgi:DNA polymerase III subunit gamma/tau
MSYQVIARKYRPQRFGDVVGQEHVTQTLTNAIKQGRIAHAYLFVGPRGTGKTTIARIFAMCLNCTGGPKVDYQPDDPRCLEIAEGRSIDVLEIDGASNNGVEQVRDLRETVKYAPASSKFKIYIIDEVHMLSTAAFNALLKTLEEPPAHVKFMFATTEAEKVLPTILSRCQRFDLRRIPSALITKHLAHIAGLEKVKIDAAALDAIARGAEGGMRDAESTLDQLISFCGDKIEEADVLSMFGLTARGQILELARAVLAGEAEKALRELDELAKHGKDLGRLVSDLLNHFRNILIYQVSRGDLRMLEVSEAEAATLAAQSAEVDAGAVTRVMEVLSECEMRLRDASSKKILIEVALLRAMEARRALSLDSVLQQLQSLRGGEAVGAAVAPQSAPASTQAAVPKARQVAPPAAEPAPAMMKEGGPAPTNGNGDLAGLWDRLFEAVARASQFTKTYLQKAHPVSFKNNVLVIGYDPEFEDDLGLVDSAKTHTLLQTKLGELGHAGAQVKFVKAERPADWTPPTVEAEAAQAPAQATARPASPAKAGPVSKDDFKNDPLIQKALEIFKGQIVEVRS